VSAEPLTNPAPTDRELYPAQDVTVGLAVRTRAGEDPVLLSEQAEETIIACLRECGEDGLLDRIREAK